LVPAPRRVAAWTINRHEFWLAPLTFAPIYLTYRTYRIYLSGLEAQQHLKETSDLHLATIEALAAAIDAKDQMTRVHIRRVQAYAARLAEALNLSPGEIQAVRTAALLHDIGKLAIPAHILSKPGPLTPEEFAKVRIHPQIGAEIIASVPFPYPVAPIVLSHHERWDGTGYPQALSGDAIPIGARIISVVDYFDVITSERPFHNALSLDSALALMKHEAGRALDPALVDLFVEKLPEFSAIFDAANVPAPPAQDQARAGTLVSPEANAFENIALAHQEIYALYEIAQTMGTTLGVADTMGLIASKLAAIIPWAGCALLVQEGDTGELLCRFAIGVDAPLLLRGRLRVGEGLSGWVARHRRTLVNASPRIEFEAAGVPSPAAIQTAIVCPLELGDRFIGTLALFHTEPGRYTEDHRRLLARVAEQAAAVVNNALVFEQTQEESLTDPLTGLPNRRSMMARLSSEISRSERAHSQLAVIVIDVDGFKQINDSCGHAVGDKVLREIARALLESLRPYDLCVRFAGDEFVIVLGDCSPEAAESKRQELQRRIEDISIAVDTAMLRVGASAGAANYPYDGDTHDALLATADRRMYSDKALRRRFATMQPAAAADWEAAPAATPGRMGNR
jgi:diguanylate cyclase (GGDEF)-like protein/putative nucleotidyltransferase with HDIG domain